MNQPPIAVQWRRSSYSNGAGGECVEVADLHSMVGIRDSKWPSGSHIAVRHGSWARFITSLRAQ
ncbi:DUF397 domain-containing protein [Streptomyces sp. NPDC001455]|uniref:DUF397 domain-containing protein n=1 Tax=unclassified Streptomyces TaxID=2593676 RepID=UPI00332A5424